MVAALADRTVDAGQTARHGGLALLTQVHTPQIVASFAFQTGPIGHTPPTPLHQIRAQCASVPRIQSIPTLALDALGTVLADLAAEVIGIAGQAVAGGQVQVEAGVADQALVGVGLPAQLAAVSAARLA